MVVNCQITSVGCEIMLQQAEPEVEGLDGGALFMEEGAVELLDY